jgi:hypothetical protein
MASHNKRERRKVDAEDLMNDQTFDTFARRAADACDRRSALAMLAGAVLGSISSLPAAGKGGGND